MPERRKNPLANSYTRRPSWTIPQSVWIILAGLLALGMIWGVAFGVKNMGDTTESSDEPQAAPSTAVVVTQTVRSVSGKSPAQDKKDAVAEVERILKIVGASKVPTDQRLAALDKGDESSVDPALSKLIAWGDNPSKDYRRVTLQALISMEAVIREKSSDKKIAVSDPDAWQAASTDSQRGIVYVPMGVFTGTSVGFHFEMVYDKSRGWMFAPYGFVDAVRASTIAAETTGK